MDRYIIEEDSASGHCCFGYSILDTHRKEEYTKADGSPYYICVAECFYKEDAVNIVNTLNSLENNGKS